VRLSYVIKGFTYLLTSDMAKISSTDTYRIIRMSKQLAVISKHMPILQRK